MCVVIPRQLNTPATARGALISYINSLLRFNDQHWRAYLQDISWLRSHSLNENLASLVRWDIEYINRIGQCVSTRAKTAMLKDRSHFSTLTRPLNIPGPTMLCTVTKCNIHWPIVYYILSHVYIYILYLGREIYPSLLIPKYIESLALSSTSGSFFLPLLSISLDEPRMNLHNGAHSQVK